MKNNCQDCVKFDICKLPKSLDPESEMDCIQFESYFSEMFNGKEEVSINKSTMGHDITAYTSIQHYKSSGGRKQLKRLYQLLDAEDMGGTGDYGFYNKEWIEKVKNEIGDKEEYYHEHNFLRGLLDKMEKLDEEEVLIRFW